MNDEKLAGIVKELWAAWKLAKRNSAELLNGLRDHETWRSENAKWETLASLHMPAILDALAAKDLEIERLRGALETIVRCECPFSTDRLKHAQNAVAHCRDVATEALNPTKEGGSDDK